MRDTSYHDEDALIDTLSQVQMALHADACRLLFGKLDTIRLVGGATAGRELDFLRGGSGGDALAAARDQAVAEGHGYALHAYLKSVAAVTASGRDLKTTHAHRLGHGNGHDTTKSQRRRYNTLIGDHVMGTLSAVQSAMLEATGATPRDWVRAPLVASEVVLNPALEAMDRGHTGVVQRAILAAGGNDATVRTLRTWGVQLRALARVQAALAVLITQRATTTTLPRDWHECVGHVAADPEVGKLAEPLTAAMQLVYHLLQFRAMPAPPSSSTPATEDEALLYLHSACERMRQAKWTIPRLAEWPKDYRLLVKDRTQRLPPPLAPGTTAAPLPALAPDLGGTPPPGYRQHVQALLDSETEVQRKAYLALPAVDLSKEIAGRGTDDDDDDDDANRPTWSVTSLASLYGAWAVTDTPTPTAEDRRLVAALLREVGVDPPSLDAFIKTPELHRPALGLPVLPAPAATATTATPSLWDRARQFLKVGGPAAADNDTLDDDDEYENVPVAKKKKTPPQRTPTLSNLGVILPPLAELRAAYPTAKELLATAQTSDDITQFLQSYTPMNVQRTWPDLTAHLLQQQYGLTSWTLRGLGWV